MPQEPNAEIHRLQAEMTALITQMADLERRIEEIKAPELPVDQRTGDLIRGMDVIPAIANTGPGKPLRV